MARNPAWIVLAALTVSLHATGIRVASFNIGAHLVSPGGGEPAYFDYGIGPPGAPDHDAVRDVLARIAPDVVALEEIHAADVVGPANNLDSLASGLGFPHVFVCPTATAFDSSLRVVILSRFPFLESSAIASPPGARDMSRLMPVVRVDIPGTANDPMIIAAHLKSGSAASDMLQRTAEMRRLTNFLTDSSITSADNFIITGDFNLSATSRTFTSLPSSGLPGSFALGDTTLPLDYFTDPRAYFTTPPVSRILPRQLDGNTATYPTSSSSIDLFLTSPLLASRPHRTEIYNSALDDGGGLPKAGTPLAGGTSLAASDHLAIFGDFELDPAAPATFHAAGDTVTASFDAFPGTHAPYPWVTTGGTWRGADDGSSHAPGFRSYGTSADGSLGVLTGATPANATISFINDSPTLLRALHISYTAEHRRSGNNGTASTLTAELLDGYTARPLPTLDFTASTQLPDGPLPDGIDTQKSAIIRGLAILPGATFQLRFTAAPATPAPAEIFVNSFHYDNTGTDQGEFIDIVAGPGFVGNVSDIGVLFYNGADGKPYKQLALDSSDFTRSDAPDHFVHFVAELGSSVQNGPDGIAIVHTGTRELIEFISYEGVITATEGIAAGSTSVDIGVFENGSEPVGQSSLGRVGNGGLAADFTWAKIPGPPSRGAANAGQSLVSTTPPPQGIAIDNLSVTFLSDSDGDGITDADEQIFGSDPDDAASRFIATVARTEAGTTRITFPTFPGRSYTVETGTDLNDWTDIAGFIGNGDTVAPEFTIAAGEAARFYRIRVTME